MKKILKMAVFGLASIVLVVMVPFMWTGFMMSRVMDWATDAEEI